MCAVHAVPAGRGHGLALSADHNLPGCVGSLQASSWRRHGQTARLTPCHVVDANVPFSPAMSHLSCAGTQLVSAGADGLIKLWSVRLSGEAGMCVLSCVLCAELGFAAQLLAVHTANQYAWFDGHGVQTPPRPPPSLASTPRSPASPRPTKQTMPLLTAPHPQNASTPSMPTTTRCGPSPCPEPRETCLPRAAATARSQCGRTAPPRTLMRRRQRRRLRC